MEAWQIALFEDPLGIYIALAIIGALGLLSYLNWRTLKAAWPATVALVAATTVFAVSTLVVTDREKIRAACDEIAEIINSGNTQFLEGFIDKDFAGPDPLSTRIKAIRWVARNLEEYEITGVKFKILELNVRDDLATMSLQSDVKTETISVMRLHWGIVWIKRSTGWLIYKARGPMARPEAPEEQEDRI